MERKQVATVFSRIGLSLFTFLVVQQLIVAVVMALFTMPVSPFYSEAITQAGWFLWVVSYVPLYLIAFPIAVLILRTIPDGEDPPREKGALSAGQMTPLVIACFGIVYPLNLVSMLLSTLIAQLKGAPVVNPLETMVTNSNPWVNLVAVAFIAPIMEEIMFRWLLYKKLRGFGGKTYVIVSAAIFALFHCNLYQILYAFVLGLLFAGITYYTGTVKYAIILHVAINLIGNGISAIVMHYGGELAMGIWGVVIIALAVAGIVIGIVTWRKYAHIFRFGPGVEQAPEARTVILNPGIILFTLLTVGLMVAAILM
jgi:membrane protease YdiL (CAAX protease family)